jgi:hypothetical protein
MADDCTIAEGEDRRGAPAFEAEPNVSNGVDTAMKAMQTPGSDSL